MSAGRLELSSSRYHCAHWAYPRVHALTFLVVWPAKRLKQVSYASEWIGVGLELTGTHGFALLQQLLGLFG